MNKLLRLFSLCLVLCPFAGACSSAIAPPARSISFQVAFQGHRASDFPAKEGRVIKTLAEWQTLQSSLRDDFLMQPAPGVDFSQQSALIIFAGEKSSGGYAIQVDDVLETSYRLQVRARVVKPDQNVASIQVITYPFVIVVISHTVLPVEFMID